MTSRQKICEHPDLSFEQKIILLLPYTAAVHPRGKMFKELYEYHGFEGFKSPSQVQHSPLGQTGARLTPQVDMKFKGYHRFWRAATSLSNLGLIERKKESSGLLKTNRTLYRLTDMGRELQESLLKQYQLDCASLF